MIVNSANQYGVPPDLALAVASHESGFNPLAVNPSGGAAGVMQLMPATSQTLGVSDPLDAQQNINGGVQLLAQLLTKYNGDQTLALWAYSNGSGSVTAGGSNPANMPAQAAGLVSYAASYQPPAGLDLGPVSDGTDLTAAAPLDFSSLSSSLTGGDLFGFLSSFDPVTLAVAGAGVGVLFLVFTSKSR